MTRRNHFIARRLLAAGILLCQVPTYADIVGYWRFEDGSGGTAADETGTYPGDLTGFYYLDAGSGDTGPTLEGWSANVFAPTVPQTGAANTGSIRMGGGGAFVDLSNGQDMYLGTSYTIEFFMMPEGGSMAFSLSPFAEVGLGFFYDPGGLTMGLQFGVGGTELDPYFLATNIQLGVWQHIALVKEPGEYSVYLNGELLYNDGLPASVDGPYAFPGTDFSGDRTIGGDGTSFNGYIDEFRISDTALTPDQFLIVPEPSTILLIAIGGLSLAATRRKLRSNQNLCADVGMSGRPKLT